ncbi:MAG: acylneuraminate cytidylyltransferase family protein [Verrucomicrobiota bacterium]
MAINSRPVLALIPARCGSKGLPGKNTRLVNGKPLIQYTLEAAIGAKRIDQIFVSSDDPLVLRIACGCGVVGLERPPEIAIDTASADAVVEHFLGTLPSELLVQDPYIIYLQPTSPLRSTLHIEEALSALEGSSLHTLLSVEKLEKSPFKSFVTAPDGSLQSLFDERKSNFRRQDLPAAFHPNGAIYLFRVSDFKARGSFPSNGSLPYFMNGADSIDIDTEHDLTLAASFLK